MATKIGVFRLTGQPLGACRIDHKLRDTQQCRAADQNVWPSTVASMPSPEIALKLVAAARDIPRSAGRSHDRLAQRVLGAPVPPKRPAAAARLVQCTGITSVTAGTSLG